MAGLGAYGRTMLGLADNLGNGLSDRVKNYIIPALTVDLKGLSGADAATKLNGVISTMLDTMSTAVFGDIVGVYQQLGEGMLETAVRIVTEVAVVKDALGKSGISLVSNAIAISDSLIQAAGGIKEFQSAFTTYYDKFYNDGQKQTITYRQLTEQLAAFNTILPTTRAGYKALVESLNLSNEADQKRYTLLIGLSSAADTYYSTLGDIQNGWQNVADSLVSEIKRIKGLLSANVPNSYAVAQSAFSIATAQARAGDQTAAGTLPELSKNLLDLAAVQAKTAYQLTSMQLSVMASLEATDAVIAKKQGTTIPKFASGGDHSGGWAMVGEQGPELVNMPAGRVFNHSQSKSLTDNSDLIAEIRALRVEVAELRRTNEDAATNTRKTADLLTRVTRDGESLLTTTA